MAGLIGDITLWVYVPLFVLFMTRSDWYWAAGVAMCFVIFTVLDAIKHNNLATAVDAAIALLYAYIAWNEWKNRNKKKRKRALQRLGNKGRALISNLVRKVREHAQAPRRAPLPQGA